MTDETTIWTKGDDPAALIHMLERATEARVRVTAVYDHKEWGHTVESVPGVNFEGDWVGRNYYITRDLTPVSFLVSVTSLLPPEPVRPSWLPADAEEGDWLLCDAGVAQYGAGRLHWPSGNVVTSPGFYVWSIWPLWAQVKVERERLTAEVERLSTVTDEMVAAAISAVTPTDDDVHAALTAALAKRDEGQP